MVNIEYLDNLKNDLINKINQITSLDETPVIFFLIGTYPGFTWHHQTPPIICDMIKDEKISPIVIMFDPQYNKCTKSLLFLTENVKSDITPGSWYYPNYIKEIDDSYNFRVAYQYHTFNVDDQILYSLLQVVSPHITLLWSFTGLTFREHNNNLMCHIPQGNCMADVQYDYEYHPQIVSGKLKIKTLCISTLKDFIDKILIEKNVKKISLLHGYIYNYIKKWTQLFQLYRKYEIRIRTDDPKICTTLSKSSSINEWDHLKYRLGSFYNKPVKELISKFMESQFETLVEYLNNEIYDTGNIILILYNLDEYSNINNKPQLIDFIDNHTDLINQNEQLLPSIFMNFIRINENKYNNF
jgi:hypothetical protein